MSVTASPAPAQSASSPSGSPLGRLLAYARPHRGQVILASTYSVLNKAFDLAPPLLIGAAVDVVVRRKASMLAACPSHHKVFAYGIGCFHVLDLLAGIPI